MLTETIGKKELLDLVDTIREECGDLSCPDPFGFICPDGTYDYNSIELLCNKWMNTMPHDFKIDESKFEWRLKEVSSLEDKLYRHMDNGDHIRFVCNDWLGIRCLVKSYNDIPYAQLEMRGCDISHQHSNGYNAIHLYLYGGVKFPIEIQLHTPFDYRFNIWNRKHNYKKINQFGRELRSLYERGLLETEEQYVNVLNDFKERYL